MSDYDDESESYDVYSASGARSLLDDDELSAEEEGFMRGYEGEL